MKLFLLLLAATATIHVPTEYRTITGKMQSDIAVCTAVFIAPDVLLTAGHCLETVKGPIALKTSDNKFAMATVIGLDPEIDLGLLKTDIPFKHYVSLGKEPKITDKVYAVHSGGGVEHTYGEGFIQNITRYEGSLHPMIMDSIKIREGASGSGLFDGKGRLVGINTITTEMGSMAVDIDTVKKFLSAKALSH